MKSSTILKPAFSAGLLLASFSLSFSQNSLSGAQTEAELAERVITRVQEIVNNTNDRLDRQIPDIDTVYTGGSEPQLLQLWMENGKAVKLTVAKAASTESLEGQSTYYFGGPDLFFVDQPHAKFIFIEGAMEYWLTKDWENIPITEEQKDRREAFLYDEVNKYMGWLFR